MDPKNIIVVSNENRLLYMGENLLSHLVKRKLKFPFSYAGGRLEEKDLFLLLIPDGKKLSARLRFAAEAVSGLRLPGSGHVILAGGFLDPEVNVLMKTPSEKEWNSPVLLNTVFHGHTLRISSPDPASSIRTVSISGQEVEIPTDTCPALIAFNEEGIRYFSSGRTELSELTAAEVLEGRDFGSFCDRERLQHESVFINDVLEDELADILMQSEKGTSEQFASVQETAYYLRQFSFKDASVPISIWLILRREEMLPLMVHDSQIYTEMDRRGQLREIKGGYTFGLWGSDPKVDRIRYLLQKGAVTNTTILLTGESGTGKTFLAREIHKCSRRKDKPFIHVNCAAIPYNLIESELFGYEEGAFTGAKKGGRAGYFQMADQGTLFLDEITELPLPLQGKLLEVMQNRTYFPVGSDRKKQADVRIIAATNKDLRQLVDQRSFREDLYYRINVFPIEIPPLRERMDSLLAIVSDLLPEICSRLDIGQQVVNSSALDKMKLYSWPGNIRELENVLEKACILSDGKMILPDDIEIAALSGERDTQEKSLKVQREDFEKKVILQTLKACGGSRVLTARRLQIGKTSLFEKMKKYGIEENESEE